MVEMNGELAIVLCSVEVKPSFPRTARGDVPDSRLKHGGGGTIPPHGHGRHGGGHNPRPRTTSGRDCQPDQPVQVIEVAPP